MMMYVLDLVENIVLLPSFAPVPTMFSKDSYLVVVKTSLEDNKIFIIAWLLINHSYDLLPKLCR